MRTMVIRACSQTGSGGVVHYWVSRPYASQLIDNAKYWEPDALPHSDDDTERRRHRSRGPTLRSLVKLAQKCDSAEQMGEQLKRRSDRSLSRQGLAPPGARDQREFDAQLDRLLAQD